jgi:hypothetical protein
MRSLRLNTRLQVTGAFVSWFVLFLILLNSVVQGSYKVVLKDGKTLEARAKPVSMEGQYRFTAADGKFCILPVGQVDLPATEAANKALPRGQSSSKPITNEDLATNTSPSLSGGDSSVSPNPRKSSEDSHALSGKAVLAEKGRDEQYWRKRAKVLRDQIAAVDKEINDLNEKIRDKKGEGITVGMGTYSPYLVAGLNNLQSKLSALQSEKERLQKQSSDLEEEARKAGAMPGWLR